MAGITVVARMKAKAGLEEQVKNSLLALVGPSRADEGCVNYDLHQSSEDKGLFLFYENWAGKEDLNRHLGKAHLKAFLSKAETMLAEPVEITFWEMVSERA
jgi:quinol monooxygenase YgiN